MLPSLPSLTPSITLAHASRWSDHVLCQCTTLHHTPRGKLADLVRPKLGFYPWHISSLPVPLLLGIARSLLPRDGGRGDGRGRGVAGEDLEGGVEVHKG